METPEAFFELRTVFPAEEAGARLHRTVLRRN
jgi:hypothetical protein